MKVLFTKDYGKEKFDKIKSLGYEIIYYDENIVTNNEDVDNADILVTYNPFQTLDITKMNNLKYIHNYPFTYRYTVTPLIIRYQNISI